MLGLRSRRCLRVQGDYNHPKTYRDKDRRTVELDYRDDCGDMRRGRCSEQFQALSDTRGCHIGLSIRGGASSRPDVTRALVAGGIAPGSWHPVQIIGASCAPSLSVADQLARLAIRQCQRGPEQPTSSHDYRPSRAGGTCDRCVNSSVTAGGDQLLADDQICAIPTTRGG